MTLGQRLKELRAQKNHTLRELAKLVGIDFTYLSKIENDKTDGPPSEDLLRRLATELGGDGDELVGLSGDLPLDLREAVAEIPDAVAFLRSAVKHLTPEGWARLKEDAERKSGERTDE